MRRVVELSLTAARLCLFLCLTGCFARESAPDHDYAASLASARLEAVQAQKTIVFGCAAPSTEGPETDAARAIASQYNWKLDVRRTIPENIAPLLRAGKIDFAYSSLKKDDPALAGLDSFSMRGIVFFIRPRDSALREMLVRAASGLEKAETK